MTLDGWESVEDLGGVGGRKTMFRIDYVKTEKRIKKKTFEKNAILVESRMLMEDEQGSGNEEHTLLEMAETSPLLLRSNLVPLCLCLRALQNVKFEDGESSQKMTLSSKSFRLLHGYVGALLIFHRRKWKQQKDLENLTEDIAQWVKCLLYKHGDLSFVSKIHVKS